MYVFNWFVTNISLHCITRCQITELLFVLRYTGDVRRDARRARADAVGGLARGLVAGARRLRAGLATSGAATRPQGVRVPAAHAAAGAPGAARSRYAAACISAGAFRQCRFRTRLLRSHEVLATPVVAKQFQLSTRLVSQGWRISGESQRV